MKKIIYPLALMLIASLLSACVQVEPDMTYIKEEIAISAVRDSQKTYPKGSVFSLEPKFAKETSLKPEQTRSVYQLYTNSIISNLTSNGFNYSQDNNNVDFHVGFGIALSSDVSDDKLSKKFGLSPGLPEHENLKKGSIIVYVQDARSGKSIWRGAVQGFAHEKLSQTERQSRTQGIVNKVLGDFVRTNNNL